MKPLIYLGLFLALAFTSFTTVNAATITTTKTTVTTTSTCPAKHYRHHRRHYCHSGCYDRGCYRERVYYREYYPYYIQDDYAVYYDNGDPYACVGDEDPASCSRERYYSDTCFDCGVDYR